MPPVKNSSQALMSINRSMIRATKAMNGNLPFPGEGGGGGSMMPMYSSYGAWDSALEQRYSGSNGQNIAKYFSKLGDLSNNSLLVSVVRWLGNAIQEAPLVVKDNPEGGSGESTPVKHHPLVQLWNKPNRYYSGSTLRKAVAFSRVMNSNAYIIKNVSKRGDIPLELWWEPHWTIRPVWPKDGSEFISYYEVLRNGQWLGPIPTSKVIHLRDGLSPFNQREGFSGIPSVVAELYGDNQAAEYYASLMGGAAVPPFLVSIDKDMYMDQGAVDKLTADLIAKTTGKRRGEPIVGLGTKAYKLGFNPRELDLRESRYMAEDRFCAVMGIPAVVLELGTGAAHSIYNNVKQAEERAWDSYLSPMLKEMQEELTVQLLSDWEDPDTSTRYCEYDKSKVQALQEDEDKKTERIIKQYSGGLIKRSEGRSKLGYGPSDPKNKEADEVFAVMAAPEKAEADQQAADKAAVAAQEKTRQLALTGNVQGVEPIAKPGVPIQKKKIALVAKSMLDVVEHKHKFSSVQVILPADVGQTIQEIGRGIPTEELDAQGLENRPHITVLYGLHTQNFEDVVAVLQGIDSVKVTFGDMFIFAATEDRNYDVLNFKVKSPDLVAMHKALKNDLDSTVTFSYKPHACVAYLKPGEGKKYVGMANDLTGTELEITRVVFSTLDGIKVEVPLGQTMVQKAMDLVDEGIAQRIEEASLQYGD